MNILVLCNKTPYPPVDGGSVAMHALIENIADQGHQITVLVAESHKHPLPSIATRPQVQLVGARVNLHHKPCKALWCLIRQSSYVARRFYHRDYCDALKKILSTQTFDLVQLEHACMGVYVPDIKQQVDIPCILRAPNVEHLLWKSRAKQTTNLLRKILWRHFAKNLKTYEIDLAHKVDGIMAISAKDAQDFRAINKKLPVTVLLPIIPPSKLTRSNVCQTRLGFLGPHSWAPNAEGMASFFKKSWPLILKNHPQAEFQLAGQGWDAWLQENPQPNTVALGYVDSSEEFFSHLQIFVAPILSGGGIRIKLLEAFASGVPIVSTTLGAEGIPYKNLRNIRIADKAKPFAIACSQLLSDPQEAERIGQAGKEIVNTACSPVTVAEQWRSFVHQILSA